jgi:hypothetical protein
MSFSGTLAATDDVTPTVLVLAGDSITIVLNSSAAPGWTAILEDLTNGSVTVQRAIYTTDGTSTYVNPSAGTMSLRVRLLGALNSGVVYTIGEAVGDVIQQWTDDDTGAVILRIAKSGITVGGTVTTTGLTNGPTISNASLAISTLASRLTSAGF